MHLNLFEAALGAAAAFAVPLAAMGLNPTPHETLLAAVETVEVRASTFDFPQPGEFLAKGKPITAPVEAADVPRFRIMKQQVSLAEYARCVAAGACMPADMKEVAADVPVTGVSWIDADAYARWYSNAMGDTWRLPTAKEAAAAAAERFSGDAYSSVADDPANPAVAWIRRYREEAAVKRVPDPQPKPRGFYGANSVGLEDFGGNVWEWTSTCYVRVTMNADRGRVEHFTDNCGVRVLEGRHRAYMSTFVRDGRSGGCATGTPPENLGFRLVLEERPVPLLARLIARLRAFGA